MHQDRHWTENLNEYEVRKFLVGLVDEIEDHGSIECLRMYTDEWYEIARTMFGVQTQEDYERREGRE